MPILRSLNSIKNSNYILKRFCSELKPENEDQINLTSLYDWSVSWLNKFTGKDLSKQEREDLIKYLMPSGLFAKDARPHLYKPGVFLPKHKIYIKNGVPLYPAYYMMAPKFQEHLYHALLIYTSQIDTKYTKNRSRFVFDKEGLLKELDEKVPNSVLQTFGNILNLINNRPDSLKYKEYLDKYHKIKTNENQEEIFHTQEGEFRNLGRRKCSLADVFLTRGTGIITVNSRDINDFFYNELHREAVFAPFYEIGDKNFNVEANVIGGGLGGQAIAIRMGISMCLKQMNGLYGKILDQVKYTSFDPRVIERKKYARHKARKRYTWVAR